MPLFKAQACLGFLKGGKYPEEQIATITADSPQEALKQALDQVGKIAAQPDAATKPRTLVLYVSVGVEVGTP